jgi:dihydroorotate dehydrogenase electron transfer subunit
MSSTNHSCKTYYQQSEIVAHEQIAEATWRIRVDCPNLAATTRPGQFAMVRLTGRNDPLLARPLAIYDVFQQHQAPDHWQPMPLEPDNGCGNPRFVDFVYAVAGKFTTTLTSLRPGDSVSLWGPLGNGFQIPPTDHLVLIAGGIGQTALLMLGREFLATAPSSQATFCWGAGHASLFGHAEDFRNHGMDTHFATLDGSKGHHGTVIDLLDDIEKDVISKHAAIACCGPEGMMGAVAQWAAKRSLNCQVSLETPKA